METCKPIQEWFRTIEKGRSPLIQWAARAMDDIDCRGSYILNNSKLGWRAVHFAAKRGHVATIDMLCSNGAAVDTATSENETPLLLAMHSHMRDTVRKLINLGAQLNFNENLICQYIHRGILPPEMLSKVRLANPGSPRSRSRILHVTKNSRAISSSHAGSSSMDRNYNAITSRPSYDSTACSSQVLLNLLQCQSTCYDLELSRRKRELVRRLNPLPCVTTSVAHAIVQQTQRIARADLPVEQRLDALSQVTHALPSKTTLNGFQTDGNASLGTAVEPYLRFFEACMCESHCPTTVAIGLSQLSVLFASLGSSASNELNGSSHQLSSSDPRSCTVASYISKLLRKLITKSNPQYRAGILAHISRMLCVDTNTMDISSSLRSITTKCLSDLSICAPHILSSLVRLSETLDQPTNVTRLARFIALIACQLVDLETDDSVDTCTGRFADLADILVGWGVDPGSISRGMDLETIYTGFHFGLSKWWLITPPPDISNKQDQRPNSQIVKSIREMMCHLLEDSENTVGKALSECTPVTPTRTMGGSKSSTDPTGHLISVRLFLSVFASVFEGVTSQVNAYDGTQVGDALSLSSGELSEWGKRLLRIVKSVSTCCFASWSQSQAYMWRSTHTSKTTVRVPSIIVDRTEHAVYDVLTQIVTYTDCTSPACVLVSVYLNDHLLQSSYSTMSMPTLQSLLRLIRAIINHASSESIALDALHTYFGPRSILHSFKSVSSVGLWHTTQSPSVYILQMLLTLSKSPHLWDAVCHLVLVDFKLSLQLLQTDEPPTMTVMAKSECLGLFSLSLLTAVLRSCDSKQQVSTRYRMHAILNSDGLRVWNLVPMRLRMSILAILAYPKFLLSSSPDELCRLATKFVTVLSPSALESILLVRLLKIMLDCSLLTTEQRIDLLMSVCRLASRALLTYKLVRTDSVNVFGACVKLLISSAFSNRIYQNHPQLIASMSTLVRLSSSNANPDVTNAGSDLFLALSTSYPDQTIMQSTQLELNWYTSRRPDHSATALVKPFGHTERLDSTGLVVSASAYPNLPAVAGVLGILTRGAPYSANSQCSRLQVLQHPADWIRRLAHLISPIPADCTRTRQFSTGSGAIGAVLWYAAWTMVDYKLKVAPWANPLKTFLALEGALRALLQTYSTDSTANVTSNFHAASSAALARQLWSRQLQQTQLLITFLGYLERIVANATQGFALALQRPVGPACAFFVANEATCSQWFGRIRGLLIRCTSDLPLVPKVGQGSSMSTDATVVYHAYSLLSAKLATASDADSWKTLVSVSDDVLVHTVRALLHLSAWEEIQALADWSNRLVALEAIAFNPLGWLEGVAALAGGRWDKGVLLLDNFVKSWITLKSSTSSTKDYTDMLNGCSEAGLVYSLQLLLSFHLSEGDYKAARKLRKKIQSTWVPISSEDSTTPSEVGSQNGAWSAVQVQWTRLDSLSKLSSWSDTKSKPSPIASPIASKWSGTCFKLRLDNLLFGAAAATATIDVIGESNENKDTVRLLEDMVNDARRASTAMLTSSAVAPSSSSRSGFDFPDDPSLYHWLHRANVLLQSPMQCLSDDELANPPRLGAVMESSWRHLFKQHTSGRLNSSLQACQWACDQDSPLLAKRLFLREARTLGLPVTNDDVGMAKLLELICATSPPTEALMQLSPVQRIRFTDCLARLLWSSSDTTEHTQMELPNQKLAAINLLSHGLHTALLEEVSPNVRQHQARCQISMECALRLFQWLEDPSTHGSTRWIEVIRQQVTEECVNSALPQTTDIVQRLDFFSRLVDEPWANGLPLVPSGDLVTPGFAQVVQPSIMMSQASWTSRLLMMATRLSPTGNSARAWLRMADWCFSRGQSLIEEIQTSATSLLRELADTTDSSNIPTRITKPCPLMELLQPEECEEARDILLRCATPTGDDQLSAVDDRLPYLLAALASFLVSDAAPSGKNNNNTSADISTESTHSIKCLSNMRLSKLCPDDTFEEPVIVEALQHHLRHTLPSSILPSGSVSAETLLPLHRLVQVITQRQYSLHMSAAQAYATFLTVAGQHTAIPSTVATTDSSTSGMMARQSGGSKLLTTTATLNLLDLLSSPSRELRSLVAGFLMHGGPGAQTMVDPSDPSDPSRFGLVGQRGSMTASMSSTSPRNTPRGAPAITSLLGGPAIWEACLQQLLVRLNLPDPAIQTCLVALLGRLCLSSGASAPGLTTGYGGGGGAVAQSQRFAVHLLFPAAVAALDGDNADRLRLATALASTSSNLANSLELPVDHTTATTASSDVCFSQIIIALKTAGFGRLFEQVMVFVSELQRITLLWEELWLGTLTQHMDEMTKKFTLLESEIKRSTQFMHAKNDTCSLDKENLGPITSHKTQRNVQVKEVQPNRLMSNHPRQQHTPSGDEPVKRETPKTSSQSTVVEANSTSVAEDLLSLKYLSIAQPTLCLLAQLTALTMEVQPETPHEEWFQRTFSPLIDELRESLLHPTDLTDTKTPIVLLRQLIHHLQTVHHSTGASKLVQNNKLVGRNAIATARPSLGNMLYLSLHHLSPRLTQMHFGGVEGIPLPGHMNSQSATLSSRVAVLPTKTRPKRLLFRAQTGHCYPYLLKGLEDLRLDDRVMRLFELINAAVVQQTPAGTDPVCARTYAVTPLGVRAGLLQMVQGAVPLFSLYKRWQIRANKAANDNMSFASPPSLATANVPRPGEMFHTRLKEFMLKAGLTYQTQTRSTWPVDVLKQVLHSLQSDTPADLLSRELWASNPSASQWWMATNTFARSAGLMSSLGYLIGLGDRHLDNLLVDLTTGHLIHIDYNVCFDKGRLLRVAERVPFRLTRIIRHALGPAAQDTLVRGRFRTTGEQTLQVVRTILNPVLIQLKAFLIDPLVDWLNTTRRNPSSAHGAHMPVASDFTHLGAYLGGGSSTTLTHQVATSQRKQCRIKAEMRLYAGLVVTRLSELYHTRAVPTLHDVMGQVADNLQCWNEWHDAERLTTKAERIYRRFSTASLEDLAKAEGRCCDLESASDEVDRIHGELVNVVQSWRLQTCDWYEQFKRLKNPIYLTSLLASMSKEHGAVMQLTTQLSRYHDVASVYLSHTPLLPTETSWISLITTLQSALEQFLQEADSFTDASVQSWLERLQHEQISPQTALISQVDCSLMLSHLDSLVQDQMVLTEVLRSRLAELYQEQPACADLTTAIEPGLSNLHLFVNDQGLFGVMAYCSALTDYLVHCTPTIHMLETEPQTWQHTDAETDSNVVESKIPNVGKLLMHVECLISLVSVLHHPPSGRVYFTAGYESDARREIAFLLTCRDVCACLNRLHTDFTTFLLSETTEAVLESTGDLAEQFSTFVARTATVTNPSALPEEIARFLKDTETVCSSTSDRRLHQVLVAVHLALTNSAAQLEEMAQRIREFSVTAPAWYYVDSMAQVTATMLARASWREGATNLWGWEMSNAIAAHTTTNESIPVTCSWLDEVYASGLMTFVSVLEECRAHWHAVRTSPVEFAEDLVLTPLVDMLNQFFGRLSSRLALASLVSLTAGRLFCALIENSGLSIRRLVMENEMNAKLAGATNSILSLSASKLSETAGLHAAVNQPLEAQHLRGPAANLIHRLVDCAGKTNEQLRASMTLALADRHLKHLIKTQSVLQWIHTPLTDVEPEKVTDCERAPTALQGVLRAIDSALTVVELPVGEDAALVEQIIDLAKAISFVENVRISGLDSCPIHAQCQDLLMQLKEALNKREIARVQLTDLDQILLELKVKHDLSWPLSEWLFTTDSLPIEEGTTHVPQTLRTLLTHEVSAAKSRRKTALQSLVRTRNDLRGSVADDDIVAAASVTKETDKPVVIPVVMGRQSTKSHNNKHAQSSASPDQITTTMAKSSTLVGMLRASVTALQCERLAEIRQLIKLLSRYEITENSLLMTKVTDNNQPATTWTQWLDTHQHWTSSVLQLFKQFAKFVQQLDGSNNAATDSTNRKRAASDQLDQLRREQVVAGQLFNECLSSRARLYKELLLPLMQKLRYKAHDSDERLAALCGYLLDPFESELKNLTVKDVDTIINETKPIDVVSTPRLDEHHQAVTTQSSPLVDQPINPLALTVWSRVRDRLTGHDPLLPPPTADDPTDAAIGEPRTSKTMDPSTSTKTLSVPQQVDACIRAATDVENLALMYEGWTAWV